MREMVSAAQRLRAVKSASREFLSLWALERLHRRPAGLDRVVADVQEHAERGDRLGSDWPVLDRGNILDD